ncbi:hypothetical protein B7494_g4873 [Chlorociboria aeruginascens]|nr:hypothetical protein B7494_g4873 [Chlorociboria aeruginascens]
MPRNVYLEDDPRSYGTVYNIPPVRIFGLRLYTEGQDIPNRPLDEIMDCEYFYVTSNQDFLDEQTGQWKFGHNPEDDYLIGPKGMRSSCCTTWAEAKRYHLTPYRNNYVGITVKRGDKRIQQSAVVEELKNLYSKFAGQDAKKLTIQNLDSKFGGQDAIKVYNEVLEEITNENYNIQKANDTWTPVLYYYLRTFGSIPAFGCYVSNTWDEDEEKKIWALYEQRYSSRILPYRGNLSHVFWPSSDIPQEHLDIIPLGPTRREYLGRADPPPPPPPARIFRLPFRKKPTSQESTGNVKRTKPTSQEPTGNSKRGFRKKPTPKGPTKSDISGKSFYSEDSSNQSGSGSLLVDPYTGNPSQQPKKGGIRMFRRKKVGGSKVKLE